jgi:signal peptidase II
LGGLVVASVAWGGVVAGLVALVDQLSKLLVLRRLGGQQRVELPGGVRLRLVLNYRSATALSATPTGAVTLWVLAIASIVFIAFVGGPFGQSASAGGFGAALGGAIGNSLDRHQRGGVVDFIEIGWWPNFNLADAAIVGGIAFALASVFV